MTRIDGNDCKHSIGGESFDFEKQLSKIKKDLEKLVSSLFPEEGSKRESPFDEGAFSTRKLDPTGDPPKLNLPAVNPADTAQDLSGRGKVTVVDKPIVVDGGVFDGKGATFTASSALGDGGQSESQQPIFILKNGATLKNVDIGKNGADGIHVYNGANLQNVNWQDVGEDALTVKSAGDVNITGGSARGATDKIFQLNANTNLHIKDFSADGFQTFVRTNGGKQIDANVSIEGGQFANGTNLFRTDSSSANVNFAGDIVTENVANRIRNGNDVVKT